MNWRIDPFEIPGSRRVLLPAEMAAADAWAIHTAGVPALALMENAARHVALAAAEFAGVGQGVWVLCGGGNNGADGLAAARHLAAWGRTVTVVLASERLQLCAAGLTHLSAWEASGQVAHDFDNHKNFQGFASPAVVVDALLGTGQRGPARGAVAQMIEALAQVEAPVVAVDIPSGLCGVTGRPLGAAVRARLTVTFGASKLGHWLFPGPEYTGALRVVDIGLPAGAIGRTEAVRWILGDADLAPALRPLEANAHKGRAGRVLVVAGSPGRTGAACLAAQAALRSGAGLVTIGTTAAAFAGLAPTLREVMAEPLLPDGDDPQAEARLVAALNAGDAGVVGPGLPANPGLGALLALALPQVARPLVIDAEALNLLAGTPQVLGQGGARVLTPHPGEAGRLLGCTAAEVQADRIAALTKLVAQTGAVVVLKGAHTLVLAPDGRLGICPEGNAGMASAGMGDVLGGVIAALLARGLEAFEAAAAGVLWHARAGDRAAVRRGQHTLNASDVIDALGAVESGGW